MVSTVVSKMGMTELIFVDPGMKVIGQYYRDVLLSQQMLPAIKHAIHLSFNKTTLHPTVPRTPLKCYSKKHWTSLVRSLATKQLRPESSGLLGLGCYAAESVWMLYEQCQWAEAAPHWRLEQSAAERYWRGHWRRWLIACMRADEQHFEHLLWARVTDKSCGQIKSK